MHACLNPACYRWGTSLQEFVTVSRDVGFTSVEVSIQQACDLAEALGGPAALTSWVDEVGVTVEQFSGILPAGPVLPAPLLIDHDSFTHAMRDVDHRLEVAAAMSCRRAAIVLNPAVDLDPRQVRDLTLSRLRLLADRAAGHEIALAVEFVGLTDPGEALRGDHPFICSAPALGELLDDLAHPHVGMLLDLCHLYASGTSIAAEPALHGRISFVQVCDIPAQTPPEAMRDDLRELPGAGALDFHRIRADLLAAGYDGPLSIELFSPALWSLSPPEAAVKLFASTGALLGSAMLASPVATARGRQA